MKYVKQFGIILFVTFLGELLKMALGLPIPASIYGLCLMLLALKTGVIRLEHVESAATFLIEAMPVMFIPAAVGLTESWGELRPVLLPVVVITLLTTPFVMAATGRVAQRIIRRGGKDK